MDQVKKIIDLEVVPEAASQRMREGDKRIIYEVFLSVSKARRIRKGYYLPFRKDGMLGMGMVSSKRKVVNWEIVSVWLERVF